MRKRRSNFFLKKTHVCNYNIEIEFVKRVGEDGETRNLYFKGSIFLIYFKKRANCALSKIK